jgi:hypothetical protein
MTHVSGVSSPPSDTPNIFPFSATDLSKVAYFIGVADIVCLVGSVVNGVGYYSFNGNLRLVLLTRCFKQLSDPNATVVYCGNTILLTVRMYFVVFIN